MNTYPLLKTKMSNERLMSALLLVLLLYNLPRFIANPGSILSLLLLLAVGLLLDTVVHFIIYKRPICAVSAAVTALILYTLSPGAPFWAECASLAAALVAGKAIWGGTGKNPLNPAMIGLAFLALLSPLRPQAFDSSFYLLPAVLLSLPFLYIRPYAGLGMMVGMVSSLLFNHNLTEGLLLSNGVFFWGCLVITDPVTTTSKPAAGFVIGLLAGFVPGAAGSAAAMPIGILVSNLLSCLTDWLNIGKNEKLKKTFGRYQKIKLSADISAFTDLTDTHTKESADISISCEEILRRIENNIVFGCGGAAYPAIKKISAVIASESSDKHFIINAAECDPGLVHDKWLLKNHSEEIMKGIEIIQKCIPFKSFTVAAKDFYNVSFPAPVRSHKLSDFYPAGAEKILVKDVLNKPMSDSIPAVSGILVLNIQTVYAICEAVLSNRKADSRFLTAADLDKGTGKIVRAKLGAGVRETAEKVLPHALNIYTGGGMMNARLSYDDAVMNNAVIDEKTNFLAVGQIRTFREAVCSQCNLCSAYCPASLSVREIAHLVDEDKLEKAALLHPESCMECGLCSTVCLAGRDQAKRVRTANKFATAKKIYCK